MNRAHRRAIAKGKPLVRLKPKPNPASSFAAIGRSMPLTEDEALKISNTTHVAWVKLMEGNAEIVDFDNIAQALNLARVIADGLGEPAITVAREAQDAMKGVRERYLRLGRFGADAATPAACPTGAGLSRRNPAHPQPQPTAQSPWSLRRGARPVPSTAHCPRPAPKPSRMRAFSFPKEIANVR